MVYEDAEKLYAEVKAEGKALLDEAFGALLQASTPIAPDGTFNASAQGGIVAINPTMFSRLDVVEVPLAGSGGSKLRTKVIQTSPDGTKGYALMEADTGFGLAFSRGLFSDCSAASGE